MMSIYDGGQISKQERDRPLPTVTSSWQTTKNRSVNKPEHQSVSQAGRQSSSWKAVCPETLKHLCPLLVRPVSLGPIWTWTVCSDVDIQTPGCFKASHWFWRIGDLASFFCFAFSPLKACHWAGQGGRGVRSVIISVTTARLGDNRHGNGTLVLGRRPRGEAG